MPKPVHPLLVLLAAIAAIEGAAMIGYAIFDIVQGFRVGLVGPPEVSNLPGLILQIVIFAILGVALFAIAAGWWKAKYGARAPFIVAQLLALVVGVPLIQATETGPRSVGAALVGAGLLGIALALLPPVTRVLLASDREET